MSNRSLRTVKSARSLDGIIADATDGAAERGVDLSRAAWLVLGDVTKDRGTVIAVAWDEADARQALRRLDQVVEIWPAADAADIQDQERIWRRDGGRS
jgi:hypothetical protein